MRNNSNIFVSETKNLFEKIFGKDFDFQNLLKSALFVILILGFLVYYLFDIKINFHLFGLKSLFFGFFILTFFVSFLVPLFFIQKIKTKVIFEKDFVVLKSFYNQKNISEKKIYYSKLEKIILKRNKNFFGFQGVILVQPSKQRSQKNYIYFYLDTNEMTNFQYFIEKNSDLKRKIEA
ncbi:hypothetical protein CSB11_01090 [Candidatus Campbellbacteria bacterium]|nr:MAG: hypothetical protein CSB11_01090 [Candidatus Campbellbacteria bacterium]